MTHYHNNYALVQCIDPATYKVRQEDPQQLEVDGEWIDLLPFWRWERIGTAMYLSEEECIDMVECHGKPLDNCVYKDYQNEWVNKLSARDSFASLLRSLNLDPARCLVFKQMEK